MRPSTRTKRTECGATVWMTFRWIPLAARMARSILMPPEVEPEQPQMREQMMSSAMLSGGQVVVSCVANPVVVEMEATWKEASRSAVPKEA